MRVAVATSIDDNAAEMKTYTLFKEMSVIQHTQAVSLSSEW